ncbi:hypothetical protein [Alloactinosynnema sp. L-07]|uniref:DUF4314 domain-containing protein n=1 Tax=Alloactinosynnema sp. L-07 TaxID=1653480 RepID=UPI00065EF287|nr:DUF4314 domain-containing protein [Alloactinosynnema sp. L-07]CRK56936.1 hypothetical protein [Alloactinosynnema sp. L-07]
MGEFQKKDRVELVNTTDAHTDLKPGDQGTVTFVDDMGTVHIRWDNGSSLGMSTQDGDVIARIDAAAVAGDGTSSLRINPHSVEGAAILDLYDQLKALEQEDSGGWNGGDLVNLVSDFFRGLGVNIDMPAETLPAQLRDRPWPDTVFGLSDAVAEGPVSGVAPALRVVDSAFLSVAYPTDSDVLTRVIAHLEARVKEMQPPKPHSQGALAEVQSVLDLIAGSTG